jgi:hypothetical protein
MFFFPVFFPYSFQQNSKNTCFLAKLQINLRKTAFFSKKLSKLTYVNFSIKNSSTIYFEHWKALLEKKVNV